MIWGISSCLICMSFILLISCFVVSYFKNIVSNIGTVVKKAFDPKIPGKLSCDEGQRDDGTSCWLDTYGNGVGTTPQLNDCPDGSYDVAGTCWTHNYKTSWGSVGCTGGRPFRIQGYDDCYSSDFPYVTKNIGDRGTHCPEGKTNVAGLCYNNCKEGYEFVGGNLCQPQGGPKIVKTAMQRYSCPPPGNPEYTRLTGALCYRDE